MNPAQAQHSPLPWSVQLDTGGTHVNHMVCDPKYIVADMAGKGEAGAANARFIVRACNNAQRLADALANAISAMNCALKLGQGLAPFDRKIEATRDAARAALAQWERGNP